MKYGRYSSARPTTVNPNSSSPPHGTVLSSESGGSITKGWGADGYSRIISASSGGGVSKRYR